MDRKGLSSLGLEKLVDILLEEAASNKALKSRLETALAGAGGSEEIARLIEKRLDLLAKARTSINRARARDFAVELSGLLRTIQSELGASDAFAAFEHLIRLRGLRESVERRLSADSVRLMNVFGDAETAVSEIVPAMSEANQIRAVPILERERRLDRYGEHGEFFASLLCGLARPASAVWQALLEEQIAASDPPLSISRLLQRLYLQTDNLDGLVALELKKPGNRQDMLLIAGNLLQAGRFEEALVWVRKVPAEKRILHVNGISIVVGPDYESGQRRLMEADILDALKDREAAQSLRWQVFLETFDPDVLRRYIARLDDFAEFEEMDKAFAAVLASDHIYEALMFLVEWPRLDIAAKHVLAHADKWDGRNYEQLVPAAGALEQDHPVAATIVYRALINHILDHAISNAYEHAAAYLHTLATLSLELPADPPFMDHAAFVLGLQARHPRKYGFWELLRAQLY